jgi:hypothetical protein
MTAKTTWCTHLLCHPLSCQLFQHVCMEGLGILTLLLGLLKLRLHTNRTVCHKHFRRYTYGDEAVPLPPWHQAP